MAYVIGSACINVKDTACVDACPTDAIHSKEGANQYFIDPAACIDCDACRPVCPVNAIFAGDQVPAEEKKFAQINTDFFVGFDRAQSTSYKRDKKPETAGAPGAGTPAETAKSGEIGPAVAEWKEVEGWEPVWQQHKDELFDSTEVQKRYGRVRSVFEEPDKYTLRFFLPLRVPSHMFKFKYGLPDEMCSYDVSAEVQGNLVLVRGKPADPSIRKLCGHTNSFPDRFYVEYPLKGKIASASVVSKGKHVVEVVVQKASPEAKAA